jgi:hypothetical protein
MSGASRSTARLSAGARVTWAVVVVYINIVVQLDSSRAVQLNLLESLSHNIVGLALRVLSGLDDSGLVYVALVVNIHVLEGIGELEDLILIELRVFSVQRQRQTRDCARRGRYLCSLITFMIAVVVGVKEELPADAVDGGRRLL